MLFGIILCMLIGAAGWGLGFVAPLGAVTLAIILGMLFANLIGIPTRARAGVGFTEKKILGAAIALLGFSLDYKVLLSVGALPLVLIFAGVPFTILTALGLGRLFGVEGDLALLVGTGNGICGSSAIAAAQGVLNTKEEHVGVSIAVINLLGTIGILLLPMLVSLFPAFSEQVRGMLIGNTLQAVGQVTVAGFALGAITGQTATVVKMGRILLVTPAVLIYGFILKRRPGATGTHSRSLPGIPLFIVMFLLFSLINTTGLLPARATSLVRGAAEGLLIVAMAGIGMKITFQGIAGEGKGALAVGVLTWGLQIAFSFLLVVLLRGIFW